MKMKTPINKTTLVNFNSVNSCFIIRGNKPAASSKTYKVLSAKNPSRPMICDTRLPMISPKMMKYMRITPKVLVIITKAMAYIIGLPIRRNPISYNDSTLLGISYYASMYKSQL